MGAIVRFAQDVVGVAAYFVRLVLVMMLGMGLPMNLVRLWVETDCKRLGMNATLHTLATLLFAVVGFVWFVRVRNWFFPPPDLTDWETPPWDR